MIWIEMAGGVGAGKSSLAAALRKFIQENGCTALSPEEAVRHSFERSLLSRIGRPISGKRARLRLLKLYQHSTSLFAQTRFSLKNRTLIRQVLASRRARRDLPWWHRRFILTLFFKVAGWYELFSSSKNGNKIVVVDEGFTQRAINLFAWDSSGVDLKRLQAYLNCLPVVDLIIIVRAPLALSLERAITRGLPLRLRGKDPQVIRRFFENADTIASEAARIYRANSIQRVIEVTNAGELDQAIHDLQRQIVATGLLSTRKFS